MGAVIKATLRTNTPKWFPGPVQSLPVLLLAQLFVGPGDHSRLEGSLLNNGVISTDGKECSLHCPITLDSNLCYFVLWSQVTLVLQQDLIEENYSVWSLKFCYNNSRTFIIHCCTKFLYMCFISSLCIVWFDLWFAARSEQNLASHLLMMENHPPRKRQNQAALYLLLKQHCS